MDVSKSVFAQFQDKAWPFKYRTALHIEYIAGGTPYDQRVAEGWLKTKLGADDDELIREAVAKNMAEMKMTVEEATQAVNENKHVNGFKRNEFGLYIEGRQVKAALKEAASIAVASGKLDGRGWGTTRKSLLAFLAEHVVVDNDKIYLGRDKHDRRVQRFVHTWRGTGIQYEEIVDDVTIEFDVLSDWPFTDEEWAMIWLTGQQQGLGAARSQGYGRYAVVKWEQIGSGKVHKVTGKSEEPSEKAPSRVAKAPARRTKAAAAAK